MNEKSYTELMKIGAMKRNSMKENYVQELYVEMLLSEIQLTGEREKLQQKIDTALDLRDKKSFLLLSVELQKINKRFGS